MRAENYNWYYSLDEETYHLVGSDTLSRWEVISSLIDQYELFYIARCKNHEFPYNTLFDVYRMAEDAIENYEELWGEDQDSIYITPPTKEQEKDLKNRLIAAFKEWVNENNIKLAEPFYFAHMKDAEEIDTNNYCWVWTTYSGEPIHPWCI